MTQVLVALVLVVVVGAIALVLRRRTVPTAPTQPSAQLPQVLDRSHFERPEAPWLVAVFTSHTCHVCADVARKAQVLASPEVAVQEVEFTARRDLHRAYGIDAVPALVLADAAGEVRYGVLGPISATDLWAAVAEVRSPGSTPTAGGCQNHDHG
jgi:thioredoxin-related protein